MCMQVHERDQALTGHVIWLEYETGGQVVRACGGRAAQGRWEPVSTSPASESVVPLFLCFLRVKFLTI